MNEHARILVVDDEPNIRLMFRTALESDGHTVVEAEDGEKALACLREGEFDLVLLDLLMPRLGGLRMLDRLRRADNDVPVAIVTAHGSIPDAVAAMRLGAIDFVAKPVKPETLRRLVEDVLRRHRESEPAPTEAHVRPATTITIARAVVDLTPAKRALNRRAFEEAERLLLDAIAFDPTSAEAHTLLGVLRESWGQDHAAYHCYKTALEIDPHFSPALDNLRRYCERSGLDFRSRAINPAAEG
jgi:DNA-binding response OmpR family regulator